MGLKYGLISLEQGLGVHYGMSCCDCIGRVIQASAVVGFRPYCQVFVQLGVLVFRPTGLSAMRFQVWLLSLCGRLKIPGQCRK